MTMGDFESLTPSEFEAVADAYGHDRQEAHRDNWERVRSLAAIVVSPWAKHGVKPEKLLPLPWDNPMKKEKPASPILTKEQHAARVRQLINIK